MCVNSQCAQTISVCLIAFDCNSLCYRLSKAMYVVCARFFGSPLPKEIAQVERGKRCVSAEWRKTWGTTLYRAPVWQLAALVCLQLAKQCQATCPQD